MLDPRVAYLTQSLLENVMTYGTGSAARGMDSPHPPQARPEPRTMSWFAGYSSNLLCVIWVGNDDYTDISRGLTHALQGADAAAPIWAEFMNRAIKLPQYSDMKPFQSARRRGGSPHRPRNGSAGRFCLPERRLHRRVPGRHCTARHVLAHG